MIRGSEQIEPVFDTATMSTASPALAPASTSGSIGSQSISCKSGVTKRLSDSDPSVCSRKFSPALYELDVHARIQDRSIQYQSVIDLTQEPFYKLVMPDHYYPDQFCQHLKRYQEANQLRALNRLNIQCQASGHALRDLRKPTPSKIMRAQSTLADIRNLFSPLNKLGSELRELYKKETGNVLPDRRIQDYCTIQNKTHRARKTFLTKSTQSHSPCAHEEAEQQKLPLPVRKPSFPENRLKSHKTYRKLLRNRLRKAGIKDQGIELLGFVPSHHANPKVRTRGFTDSSWSLNLLHGDDSHLSQLAALEELGLMEKQSLSWMIDHNFWPLVLDQTLAKKNDAYLIPSPTDRDQAMLSSMCQSRDYPTSRITLKGASYSLSANSPESLHHRFLTGAFSTAIQQLTETLSCNGRRELLENILRIPASPEDDDENQRLLMEVQRNLAAIEWAITEKQFHSLDNIAPFMGKACAEDLYDDDRIMTADFCTSPEIEAVIREKARRHLSKGRKILGVHASSNQLFELKPDCNLEEYKAFIVYRD